MSREALNLGAEENMSYKDENGKFALRNYVTSNIGKVNCGPQLVCTPSIPCHWNAVVSTSVKQYSQFF